MGGETIKEWREGKLLYRTFVGYDDSPDLSWLEWDYSTDSTLTAEEARTYAAQDKERLEAYYRDEWHMVFVGCEIFAETRTHWSQPALVGRAYLHGIASDSGEYINQVAKELVEEAKADMKTLQEVLCGKAGAR